MKKCIFLISLLFSPFPSVAGECEEPEWAKNLDCVSEFRKYYEYLELNFQVAEKIDKDKLAYLAEGVNSANDKTIKCASISKDEKEYSFLTNVLVKESSLLSSIRGYLKFSGKDSYIEKALERHVASKYKQLVDSVAALNEFINVRQQSGWTAKNVASPQCGPS